MSFEGGERKEDRKVGRSKEENEGSIREKEGILGKEMKKGRES